MGFNIKSKSHYKVDLKVTIKLIQTRTKVTIRLLVQFSKELELGVNFDDLIPEYKDSDFFSKVTIKVTINSKS